MNIKVKTYIIILTTFTIGILVGTLLDRTLMRYNYQHKLDRMRNPKGLFGMLNHIIEPDAAQSKEIREILQKRSKQIFEHGEKSRMQMAVIMDSLHAEIEPLLSDEQKKRLQNRIKSFKNMERRKGFKGGRRGPHRDMPMGPPPPPPDFDNFN